MTPPARPHTTTRLLLPAHLSILILLLSGCARPTQIPKQESTWTTMGTFASLTFPAGLTNDFSRAVAICREAYATINDTFSVYSPDTELSKLNTTPPHTPVILSPLAATTIATALDMAARSDGHFDPTITPLVNLWGFNAHTPPESLPTAESLTAALQATGYSRASLTADGSFTWLHEGMSLDLGGIAKGVAVDLCYDRLQHEGIPAAVINLGGNIRFLGTHPEGRDWQAGVRDPFDHDRIIGSLALPPGMALATSGNYERFVTIEGTRYAHIIDPTTGLPVQGMAGVTVVAPDATTADGLSTALFVAGVAEASTILRRFPGSEALLIPDHTPLDIHATPRIQHWLTLAPPHHNTPIHTLP